MRPADRPPRLGPCGQPRLGRARLLFAAAVLALGLPAGSAQTLPDWADPGGVSSPGLEAPAPESAVPDPPPPPVPVDGGLGWLALAGGAYGVYRLRRRRDA